MKIQYIVMYTKKYEFCGDDKLENFTKYFEYKNDVLKFIKRLNKNKKVIDCNVYHIEPKCFYMTII